MDSILIITIIILLLVIVYNGHKKNDNIDGVIYRQKLESLKEEIDHLKQRAMLDSATHKLAMETAKRESDIRIHEANLQKKRAIENEEKLTAELEKNKKLLSQKKSSEVRTGQIAEQLMPILEDFPYDRKKIRGIFNPIDAIVFEDDEIIFMEFKTGNAKLSQKQVSIKKLVEGKKVRWEERRIKGD